MTRMLRNDSPLSLSLPALSRLSLSLLSLSLLAVPLLAPLNAAQAEPLSAYAWEARPIVVFAPDADDPALKEQLARFEGRDAARADYETPLIVVAGDLVTIDGAASALDAAALRRWYDAPQDAFSVLLIGKDTGVKLERGAPIAPEEVFALINRMPMRRREVRDREAD